MVSDDQHEQGTTRDMRTPRSRRRYDMLELMTSIRAAASPLATTVPAEAAWSVDLEPLREVVGDARLVGLGESAHWSAELTGLRDRVLRFLVADLGFSIFALAQIKAAAAREHGDDRDAYTQAKHEFVRRDLDNCRSTV